MTISMTDRQAVYPGQKITETWELEFEKKREGGPVVARLASWPHHTSYAVRGDGESVDEARLEFVTMLARAIHEDPNPFGDLGNVAHISQVIVFLEALRQGEQLGTPGTEEDPEGTRYEPASDYYLPNQITDELPQGWEDVIGHVINMIKSWADFYPEEEQESELGVKPPGEQNGS